VPREGAMRTYAPANVLSAQWHDSRGRCAGKSLTDVLFPDPHTWEPEVHLNAKGEIRADHDDPNGASSGPSNRLQREERRVCACTRGGGRDAGSPRPNHLHARGVAQGARSGPR
jgi:hypothetical protein